MAKLPPLKDWKAPWEKEGEELDPERAKNFLYDALKGREVAQDKLAEVVTERDGLASEVKTLKAKDETEVQRLQRELEEAKKAPVEDTETKLENARLRLALEHGLTVKQAERLRGKTPEELEADVPELLAVLDVQPEQERRAPDGRFKTGNHDKRMDSDLSDEDATKLVITA